jgi:hypothetical protein
LHGKKLQQFPVSLPQAMPFGFKACVSMAIEKKAWVGQIIGKPVQV